jgi:hypothetical protein
MPEKMTDQQFEEFLAGALWRRAQTPQSVNAAEQAAIERALKRLSGSLPRQKILLWRLPAVLLDWQFAPAWPRVAALAGCAAIGFAIGISGLDRRLDSPDAPYSIASRGDLGSIVFEPESLTGARP